MRWFTRGGEKGKKKNSKAESFGKRKNSCGRRVTQTFRKEGSVEKKRRPETWRNKPFLRSGEKEERTSVRKTKKRGFGCSVVRDTRKKLRKKNQFHNNNVA